MVWLLTKDKGNYFVIGRQYGPMIYINMVYSTLYTLVTLFVLVIVSLPIVCGQRISDKVWCLLSVLKFNTIVHVLGLGLSSTSV